jgi:hypothetical protein
MGLYHNRHPLQHMAMQGAKRKERIELAVLFSQIRCFAQYL